MDGAPASKKPRAEVPVAPQEEVLTKIDMDMRDDADAAQNIILMQPYVLSRLGQIAKDRQQDYSYLNPAEMKPGSWAPLDILGDNKISSYKPPWSAAEAVQSLARTGMYEAAANLLWVDPRFPPPTDQDARIIAGTVPSWAQCKQLAEQFFAKASVQRVHAPGSSQGDRGLGRIMFLAL